MGPFSEAARHLLGIPGAQVTAEDDQAAVDRQFRLWYSQLHLNLRRIRLRKRTVSCFVNLCAKCNSSGCSGMEMLRCDKCSLCFHSNCSKLSDEIADSSSHAKTRGSRKWYCSLCVYDGAVPGDADTAKAFLIDWMMASVTAKGFSN